MTFFPHQFQGRRKETGKGMTMYSSYSIMFASYIITENLVTVTKHLLESPSMNVKEMSPHRKPYRQ